MRALPPAQPLAPCRHPRGMVLWITLVALLFFVALAAYVFNLGRHAARQQATQDAADAAATGGAGAIARTLNLVAHDNIEMTRLLVAAQLIDAMPQAVDYTLQDQQAQLAALRNLDDGAWACPYPRLLADARAHKAQVVAQLAANVSALTATNQLLQTADVREVTWYTTPSGQRGAFWKAMLAMDKVSQAAVEKMPLSAQASAVACGTRNLGEGAQNLSGAVPFRSEVPCRHGSFDDFYKPVTTGQIPDAAGADPLTHRGPADALWGWLTPVRDQGTTLPGPSNPGPPPPSDGSPFGGSSGGAGSTYIPGPITGYRTYGFFNSLGGFFRDRVGWINSGLASRVRQMAILKLMMAQTGAAPWNNLPADLNGGATPAPPMIPEWLSPLAAARAAVSTSPAAPINRPEAYAAWVRYEEPPRVANQPWSWTRIPQSARHFTPRGGGRVDMFFDAPQTAFRLKLGEGAFVIFTPVDIIDPQTGQVIGTDPTHAVYYFWAGIHTGNQRAVIGNPNNWNPGEEIPAPTDLLPAYATPPTDSIPGQWCALGFASQPNGAIGLGGVFKTAGRPRHTALAQARVFNNHSWDLWTPMWHAQLTPIEDYATWVATLQQTAGDAGGSDGMNTAELPGFINHFDHLKPLAPFITH